MSTRTDGFEAIRSGNVTLFYLNLDGLPLSDRCYERMWSFCIEQYPTKASEIQRVRSLLHNSPPVNFVEPPYHIARHPRWTIEEKLQHIQHYLQSLEYNYTGMQFFNINANRPLHSLMDTARYIMTESLPIKCFEAFLLAIYLTTGILGLDRFNISFKTSFNSTIYRHVVLGLKYGSNYGALGVSRRSNLAYKPLNGQYDRLSKLIDDFVRAYRSYGHQILRITIGLPVIHDLKSFLTINWQTLIIQPQEMSKIHYDRELDRIVRIWRQIDVHLTYRSIGPMSSVIQPRGALITAESLSNPNFTHRMKTATNNKRTKDEEPSSIYAIRV